MYLYKSVFILNAYNYTRMDVEGQISYALEIIYVFIHYTYIYINHVRTSWSLHPPRSIIIEICALRKGYDADRFSVPVDLYFLRHSTCSWFSTVL